MLDTLDPSHVLSKQSFKSVQREMLDRVAELSELVYEQKRAAVIVFEGWDAAGKGTTIRTLTERLDARGYKVLSTQAPRTHEKQKPWLWRFWMNIPRNGQIAIFDRSWYGRVLVERVRGLTPVPEWIAAYEEINQFERTLADDGAIFLKFWLHISRKEQLRRFIDLTAQPATAWQVTAEDWENHRLYDEYVAAVRDMLASTNTVYAPWAAVDATNREYRMYSVCRALIDRLEGALGVEATRWPAAEELAVSAEDLSAAKAAKKAAKEAEKQAKKEAEKQAAREAKAADKQAKAAAKEAKAAARQADAQPQAAAAVPTNGASLDARPEKKGKAKKKGKQPVAIGGVAGGSNGAQDHSIATEVDHA
jgi:polyphosphate kinase 2 (PPK2 family)